MDEILGFDGPNFFLSNFSRHPVMLAGIQFPTVEHGFQAAKAFSDPLLLSKIMLAETPKDAKMLGRKAKLHPHWGQRLRYTTMRTLLRSKFQSIHLATMLIATDNALIVESNTWHDNVWGDCTCGRNSCSYAGFNLLGDMLMDLRSQLNPEIL